jgi:hypothetical protein
MKVILTEDKIFNVIYKYLNSYFDVDDITMDYGLTDDEDNYNENYLVFYYGEYHGEHYTDMVFYYFKSEYYSDEPSSKPFKDSTPILDILPEYSEDLINMFGDSYWREPLKKWFEDNFKLPVKSVNTW